MKNIFKLSNLFPLLLVVYIAKSFFVDPSFFDFGVIILAFFSFNVKLKLEKDEYSNKTEMLDRISEIENEYKKDFKELAYVNDAKIVELEDKISKNSVGLGFTTRTNNVRRQ